LKTERSDVSFPVWRKKVDSTILRNACTPLPGWVMKIWDIEAQFGEITTRKEAGAKVDITFKTKTYAGFVVRSKRSRKGALYRLFLSAELCEELKKTYVMSYMRSIESHLRETKGYDRDIEKDIPFWEFLDIEYNSPNRFFYFTAYYTQEPIFPELFKSLVKSTILKQFENEDELEFTKSDWLPRHRSAEQINANNVIYYLIDTKHKLFYIGEAEKMHRRFEQGHLGMPTWDYFRYDILPESFSKKQRVALEKMLIRCFASLLCNNNGIYSQKISEYTLTNIKIGS
jgi:hypothetical protein